MYNSILLWRKAIILTLIVTSYFSSFSQGKEEILDMKYVLSAQESSEPAYRKYSQGNKSEYQLIASGIFLFYKSFISSQDGNRCSFHPSCSSYALLSIKKRGWLWGTLSVFDRLTRCNSLSPEWYDIDYKRKLLIDQP